MKLWNKSKLWISIALAFALVFTLVAPAAAEENRSMITLDFSDVEAGSWAEEYIRQMWAMGVLSGFGDGSFRPDQPITRAQAMVTAVSLMGLQDEAEDKADEDLHFLDADEIEEETPWAKGYILVGLENGLIETSAETFNPEKNAERWWVAALMVRALGLQDEALQNMTNVPDFDDAELIPQGAVGYIHVALEEDLVSGYPNDTFRPRNPVTRAEMAVLLANTGEVIEQEWMRVDGVVESIQFSDDSVSDDVYEDTNGTVVVDSDDGDTRTYHISSELLVEFDDGRYMKADQLRAGDEVVLWTKNSIVLRAELNLFGTNPDDEDDGEDENEAASAIEKFQVKLENDAEKFLLEYITDDGDVERAKLERTYTDDDEEDSRLDGDEAAEEIEELFERLELSSDLSDARIQNRIFRELSLDDFDYEEMQIRINFGDGEQVRIRDVRDDDDRDENELASRYEKFKVVLEDDDDKFLLEYETDDGDVEKAKFEFISDHHSEYKLEGEAAEDRIEEHVENMGISPEMSDRRILNRVLRELSLEDFDYEELEIHIIYTNGDKIMIERDDDDDRDDRDDRRHASLEELEIKMIAGPHGQIRIELEEDDGRYEAEVITKVRSDHMRLRGGEALDWIEEYIGFPEQGELDREQIVEDLLDVMDWERSFIRNVKIEAEYSDGSERKWRD